MKPPRIVTARPPKRRPEPDGPKPRPIAAVVHRPRRRGPPEDEPIDPVQDAAAKAFLLRMIRPRDPT